MVVVVLLALGRWPSLVVLWQEAVEEDAPIDASACELAGPAGAVSWQGSGSQSHFFARFKNPRKALFELSFSP